MGKERSRTPPAARRLPARDNFGAPPDRRRAAESRVPHSQRIEHPFLEKIFVGLPRDDLDDAPGRAEPGVGINVARARLGLSASMA